MAVAARKTLVETFQPREPAPGPRLANATDQAAPTEVHDQHRLLEAAFTERHAHPRLRAVSYSALVLASLGLWTVIISAAVHVGHMIHQ